MTRRPILIFINGPVAVGKSTVAKRYVADHKLALLLSADDFVGSMGKWREHEQEARELAQQYVGLVAREHLKAGYDVVLPYLLSSPAEITEFEQAAHESDALLFECALMVSRQAAYDRALARGTWGEPGAPPLTARDLPILERLFNAFESGLALRPQMVRIEAPSDDIEGTYQRFLAQLAKHTRT